MPYSTHQDFTVTAARAGMHVLCEKSEADVGAKCEEMFQASEESGVKMMIAYRPHFESATLKVIETINSGQIGKPRILHLTLSNRPWRPMSV